MGSGRWRLAGSNPSGFHTWTAPDDVRVQVEGHSGPVDADLEQRGHRVERLAPHFSGFGHAHLIDIDGEVLAGASDPRALTGGVSGY